ncbi:Glycerol-3-phosphate dehydrogenase [NAD(P)+] [invertebrate metagenome]|uniref:Glycerol-3-phosphate dehydrogenase [NAD(P)+] n=1 Tax=invertebrate metagenome TaxID=1711999 RepID=A0A484H9M5_9ZZZZ
MNQIGVVGAGAWGTALALTTYRAGKHVMLWVHSPTTEAMLVANHESPYLPGVRLPLDKRTLYPTTDPAAVARTCDAILLAVPAQYLRAVCTQFAPHWRSGIPVIICAKGIERYTNALMHEIIGETLPAATIAVLSGPSFAAEVARGLPTALTLACQDLGLGRALIRTLGTSALRLYLSHDVLGAEIGGAVKNVLAIGCGIVEGRALGENARAALTTRGLAEIVRLAVAVGAQAETLMGLSGLGDLILTANSIQSRNFSLGVALGQGASLTEILVSRRSVTEGVYSAAAVVERAKILAVEMPICWAVRSVLNQDEPIDRVIHSLLTRPFRTENGLGCYGA